MPLRSTFFFKEDGQCAVQQYLWSLYYFFATDLNHDQRFRMIIHSFDFLFQTYF